MVIELADIYAFVRQRDSAVVSTLAENGSPQAARLYIAATPALNLIFYTLQTNRKCLNLRRDPRIAVVIGWDSEQTLQYEGVATELCDERLEEAKNIYLEALPHRAGRTDWPGLTFFEIKPVWMRFGSYESPWQIDELSFPENRVPPLRPNAALTRWRRFSGIFRSKRQETLP